MGALQSEKMTRALELILGPKGMTAAEAAAATGISKGAISKNAQYRAHVNKQKEGDKKNV